MGLGNVASIAGVPRIETALACYGRMAEISPGKDTITGHWEMMGVSLAKPFRTYPDGFPESLIERVESAIGTRTIGGMPASGTEIIERLGKEHLRTAYPIIYTSQDSVFQMATHLDVVPLDMLYDYCSAVRQILKGDDMVARVIARPFCGSPGEFKRTGDRKDFAVEPPSPTLLDCAVEHGAAVFGVGKIEDIFAGRGISISEHSTTNAEAMAVIVSALLESNSQWSVLLANLVDFDMLYGHRNDALGLAHALEQFDQDLSSVLEMLAPDDMLIISADHGCDPTHPGTDHTREYVPLLVYSHKFMRGVDLGTRATFADVAASIRHYLGLKCDISGDSFMPQVWR